MKNYLKNILLSDTYNDKVIIIGFLSGELKV